MNKDRKASAATTAARHRAVWGNNKKRFCKKRHNRLMMIVNSFTTTHWKQADHVGRKVVFTHTWKQCKKDRWKEERQNEHARKDTLRSTRDQRDNAANKNSLVYVKIRHAQDIRGYKIFKDRLLRLFLIFQRSIFYNMNKKGFGEK